ncbi:MAG TPA: MBL fold metallo-hydrolase [Anaerolineaceae bacterium]
MGRVVILGSASAVPDAEHENTHIYVESGSRGILVDCPGTPLVRLQGAGVALSSLTDIILTHFHPDHVSGFAALVMGLWLLGRKQPLTVHGLETTLERARKLLDLHDWRDWPDFYPVAFHEVPAAEMAEVIADPSLKVYASPVQHMIPCVGLRFEFAQPGEVVAYSCDTEPSQAVRRLATGADVLIHEATGDSVGHTSPEKAGEIATQAGAKKLYLIHYPPNLIRPETMLERARTTFSGPIVVAQDFMAVEPG